MWQCSHYFFPFPLLGFLLLQIHLFSFYFPNVVLPFATNSLILFLFIVLYFLLLQIHLFSISFPSVMLPFATNPLITNFWVVLTMGNGVPFMRCVIFHYNTFYLNRNEAPKTIRDMHPISFFVIYNLPYIWYNIGFHSIMKQIFARLVGLE